MDDYSNPKRAAKLRAKTCGEKPNESKCESDEVDAIVDEALEILEAVGEGSDDEDEGDGNGEEDEGPTPGSTRRMHSSCKTPPSPSPNRRRSARAAARTDTPNYDMRYFTFVSPIALIFSGWLIVSRYHPGDAILKPNAPATIAAMAKAQTKRSTSNDTLWTTKGEAVSPGDTNTKSTIGSNLTFSKLMEIAIPVLPSWKSTAPSAHRKMKKDSRTKTPAKIYRKASNKSVKSQVILDQPSEFESEDDHDDTTPAAWSNLQNPYTHNQPIDFEALSFLDKTIYSLQKGAPAEGKTLPVPWQEVKQILFDEGEITMDELNSKAGTVWLKARYEGLCLGIEMFFRSKAEPASKMDWSLSYVEGSGVFDKKIGHRYWRHKVQSVVQPISTSITAGTSKTSETAVADNGVPETGDEGEVEQESDRAMDDRTANTHDSASNTDHNRSIHTGSENYKLPNAKATKQGKTSFEELDEDHDKTLVESMCGGARNPSSDIFMDGAELGQLLSSAESVAATSPELQPTCPESDPLHARIFGFTPVNGPTVRTSSQPNPVQHRERDLYSTNSSPHIRKRKSMLTWDKTKARTTLDTVSIYEDQPGRTPLVKRIVSCNPASPGTDLPKENLEEIDDSSQRSSQHSSRIRTPQTRRHRDAVTTPVGSRIVPQGNNVFPPHPSLFGGPAGARSPVF